MHAYVRVRKYTPCWALAWKLPSARPRRQSENTGPVFMSCRSGLLDYLDGSKKVRATWLDVDAGLDAHVELEVVNLIAEERLEN